MNDKCRTCLKLPNESIFQQINIGGNNISLVDMLKLCTGLEVSNKDEISLAICNDCIKKITKMYLYRQTCWNSEAYLLNELQNKLCSENSSSDPQIVKCEDDQQHQNVQSEDTVNQEKILNQSGTNDDVEETLPIDSDESNITYTRKQALSTYCEFIKKSPKRGSNGAWKCRKCKIINTTALRMLGHLVTVHDINIKVSKANDDDLTDALTKQEALSTYTFYPYLDQDDSSLPRTTQECRECGYTNIVTNQMMYHLRNSHNIKISNEDEFKCTQCDVKCRSYYYLLLHEKTHGESEIEQPISLVSRRNYSCSTCDQKFETQFNFNRHMKIHMRKPNVIIPKRKPWVKKCVCEHCGKTFATPHSLREHVRTHTGEKPYSCKICDYRAAHYSAILIHMRFHADIRPYKCDICDRSYVGSSGLAYHRLSHSNETPYECTICSKKFKCEAVYRKHVRSHDPETYLACQYCDRKFAAKTTLNLHIKQHTGEKPHACEFCNKRFIQRKSWRLHMKNHHQKIVT